MSRRSSSLRTPLTAGKATGEKLDAGRNRRTSAGRSAAVTAAPAGAHAAEPPKIQEQLPLRQALGDGPYGDGYFVRGLDNKTIVQCNRCLETWTLPRCQRSRKLSPCGHEKLPLPLRVLDGPNRADLAPRAVRDSRPSSQVGPGEAIAVPGRVRAGGVRRILGSSVTADSYSRFLTSPALSFSFSR
jgi:hypothetical protein